MSTIVESITQNFINLQQAVEKAIPIFNKAFPKDDNSLTISRIHPSDVEDILTALAPFIKRLPINADDLERIFPSSEFDYLNTALITANNSITDLEKRVVSFYGDNFEHAPTRSGFTFTSTDGQRTEDLKPFFQKFTTELDNLRSSIRDIGLWLSKSPKSDSITESVKTLKQERENYTTAVNELALKRGAHEKEIAELSALLTEVGEHRDSINAALKASSESLSTIESNETDAITALEEISKQKKVLEETLAQEAAIKEKIQTAIEGLNGFEQKLAKHTTDTDKYAADATDLMKTLQENLEQLESARKEAAEIIATATSASLAGAFTKEATLRANSAKNYFGWVVASLAAISVIGLVLILTHSTTLTLLDYLPRLLLMVPLSFIALVANKQLAVSRHVREEYAHKASLSLSFEGYRRLIEADEKTHTQFFMNTVSELRKNPAEKLEASENEIDTLSKVAKILNKCPDLLKKFAENITPEKSSSSATMIAFNEGNGRRRTDRISEDKKVLPILEVPTTQTA